MRNFIFNKPKKPVLTLNLLNVYVVAFKKVKPVTGVGW